MDLWFYRFVMLCFQLLIYVMLKNEVYAVCTIFTHSLSLSHVNQKRDISICSTKENMKWNLKHKIESQISFLYAGIVYVFS